MSAVPALDHAMDALDAALEHLHGPGARGLVLRCVQEVLDRRYPPDAMLDQSVRCYMQAHPGASLRDLRAGINRRTSDVGTAVQRLLHSGRLEDRGGDAGRSLYALPGPSPQGNAGNGHDATNGTGRVPPLGPGACRAAASG